MRSHDAVYADRLASVLLAFAGGLGFGLLLAPQAGSQMRRRLAEGAREAANGAGQQVRASAEPLATLARERADAFAGRHVPLAGDWDVVDGRDVLADLS